MLGLEQVLECEWSGGVLESINHDGQRSLRGYFKSVLEINLAQTLQQATKLLIKSKRGASSTLSVTLIK